MSYTPIPDDFLRDEEEKDIFLAEANKQRTFNLLERLPRADVYGLLLSADPDHPVAKVISSRWSQLHHLSGNQFLLVAFDPPKEWPLKLKEDLKKQLGDSFEKTWRNWQSGRGLEAGAAFAYTDLFNPKIETKDLPCLVLFVNPESKDAVVSSIPKWKEDELYEFLMAQFEQIKACCALPEGERLEGLRKALTSPMALAKTTVGHWASKLVAYVKEHPAQVLTSTVSLVVALATANVIPLAGPALEAAKAVTEVFGKSAD